MDTNVVRDYATRVVRHWWWIVVGAVGGVLTVVSLFASIVIPTWLGVLVLVVGLSGAQFLAFGAMRTERDQALVEGDAARDELARAVASVQGTEFRNQTLRLADLARDLGSEDLMPVIPGRLFEDCSIAGPGIVIFLGTSTLEHCRWAAPPDKTFLVLPDDAYVSNAGIVVFMGCTFRRCRFERVGVIGSQELKDRFLGSSGLMDDEQVARDQAERRDEK